MCSMLLLGAGTAGGRLSSPLKVTPPPVLYLRPDDGVYTGGCRTLTAGDKSCFQIADASQTGLDPLASDFSICGWINPSSIAAGTAVEIAKGNESATDVGWCIYRSTANLIFRCGDGVDTVSVTLGTLTAAGAWHFFAVTVDRDGNATGYLNNVANGSPQAMAAIGSMNSSDAFSIGASSAQANHAGASFASIAVANRLWTVAELTYMFNLKNNKVYAELGVAGTDGAALLTNLVSYWNCNETDPTTGLVDQHSTNDLTRTAAELLTNTGFETRGGRVWASFAAGDKAHLEAADHATLDYGTGDFLNLASIYRTSTGNQVIYSKYEDANNYTRWEIDSSHHQHFIAVVGGVTKIEMTGTTALSSTSQDYTLGLKVDRSDAAGCAMYVEGAVDTLASAATTSTDDISNTGKLYVGQSGAGTLYFNGKLAQLGIGKPADVSAAAVNTAMLAYHNSGIGMYFFELDAAGHDTTLGLTSFWDLHEASGNRTDDVGGMTLSEVLTTNLVTNGTFTEADTSPNAPTGWTNNATYPWDTAFYVESNALHVQNSGDNAPTQSVLVSSTVHLTSGRSYSIGYAATRTAASLRFVYAASALGAAAGYDATHASSATISTTFTATSSNGVVDVIGPSNAVPTNWTVDNVSITAASIPCSVDAGLFTGWSVVNGNAFIETTDVDAGSYSARIQYTTAPYIQVGGLTAGNSYAWSLRSKVNSTTALIRIPLPGRGDLTVTTNWTTFSGITTAANQFFNLESYLQSAAQYTLFDTVSCKSAAIAVGNGPSEAIASDSVGTNHGTLVGYNATTLITSWDSNVPTPLKSAGGYALTFNGSQYLQLPTGCLDVAGTAYSLSVWMKNSSQVSQNQYLLDIQTSRHVFAFYYNYVKKLHYFDGSSWLPFGDIPTDGLWHLITFVINGTSAKAYVDGVQSGTTQTCASTTINSSSAVNMGTSYDASPAAMIYGKLADVRFYSAALSEAQIAQLYAGTDYASNLVSHWNFSDGPFGIPTEGDPVWGWESLEGSRYLSNQTTAANRPVHRLTGINSLPAEEFDGVNDYLRMAGTSPFTSVDAWTAAVVIQPDSVSSSQAVLGYADEGSANNFLWFGISSDGVVTVQGKVGTNAFSVKGNTALSASTKCLLALTFDGTNYQLRVNGKAQTETRSGTEGSFSDLANVDSWTLGALLSNSTTVGSNPFNGLITEPVIYANEVTPSKVNALEKYYATRYDITLTP